MTGLQLFNLTMGLMRKLVDDGTVNEATTKKFKAQAPYVITILQAELLKAENSTLAPVIIESLDNNLLIQDDTVIRIAPYGLAAQLLIEQNPDKAAFYNDKYEELKRKIPAKFVSITDIYSIGG